jgi:hypothetical protein
MVSFNEAEFPGGVVDFRDSADWSHPPKFDWAADGLLPKGVMLPAASVDKPE